MTCAFARGLCTQAPRKQNNRMPQKSPNDNSSDTYAVKIVARVDVTWLWGHSKLAEVQYEKNCLVGHCWCMENQVIPLHVLLVDQMKGFEFEFVFEHLESV